MTRLDEIRHDDSERGLEADNAIWGVGKLALFLVIVMRRVVRGDEIDRPVFHCLAQSFHIFFSAQRWIHLRIGVVATNTLFSQRQVMRTRFCRYANTTLLSPADQFHGSLR